MSSNFDRLHKIIYQAFAENFSILTQKMVNPLLNPPLHFLINSSQIINQLKNIFQIFSDFFFKNYQFISNMLKFIILDTSGQLRPIFLKIVEKKKFRFFPLGDHTNLTFFLWYPKGRIFSKNVNSSKIDSNSS